MFTGLVESTGKVLSLEERGGSARLELEVGPLSAELALGESVAVNGCCLTVAALDPARQAAAFDLLAQTLRVTNLGDLRPGSLVNLERALRAGDRFGGHFVQGHVDATAEITCWQPEGADYRLVVNLPVDAAGRVIPKGSICLDGISLTAAEVEGQAVTCWIIPHTQAVTNLSNRREGEWLNVEYDLLGSYVREQLRHLGQAG